MSWPTGVAEPDTPLTLEELYDWETACARLAATAPWWEPGTRSGYHAISYGSLVGEVVRRITGLRPRAFLRQEITGPLGIDFTFGLPESETHRLAELVQERPDRAAANTPAWRAAEIPAANGHGTARAVAALYGILAGRGSLDGRRILSEKAAARVGEGQGACRDLVLGDGFDHETELGLGLWLSGANRSYGPDPRALGHDGAGGSCGLADPDASIALGYVMNRMGSRLADDPRKTALVNAVYAAHRGPPEGERIPDVRRADPTRVSPAVARNVRMSP